MKRKLPSLTALLFAGALACMDEAIQPPFEEPSCNQGRIWYQNACVDPSEAESAPPGTPETCRMQAERVCQGRFVYWANGCGILDDRPVSACTYRENCLGGSREPDEFLAPACEPGEVIFFDDFDSLEQWRVKGNTGAFVEDGTLELSGSVEPRCDNPSTYECHPFTYELMHGGYSLVVSLHASLEYADLSLGDLCKIYSDGRAWCPGGSSLGTPVQTGINPQDWHYYSTRLENVGDGYMDVHLQIDGQEDVVVTRMSRDTAFRLGSLWCWSGSDDPSDTRRCRFSEMAIERVEPWQPVED